MQRSSERCLSRSGLAEKGSGSGDHGRSARFGKLVDQRGQCLPVSGRSVVLAELDERH
jgi:hypothetical protein